MTDRFDPEGEYYGVEDEEDETVKCPKCGRSGILEGNICFLAGIDSAIESLEEQIAWLKKIRKFAAEAEPRSVRNVATKQKSMKSF